MLLTLANDGPNPGSPGKRINILTSWQLQMTGHRRGQWKCEKLALAFAKSSSEGSAGSSYCNANVVPFTGLC